MRAYAKRFGEDEERWAVTGLLHDMDYEKHPDMSEHPKVGVAALRELGYPEDVLNAILGHASLVPRDTLLAKALYAVDELTGFITAVALVRPSKKLAEVTLKSVKKKWKDKAFARGCDRDEMARGAEELGVPLDEHIAFVLAAMQEQADLLGL
ncbi:MAG: HD domain-containing protein [Firmicutes bacterium]|nr:HD domain-containing protein [Bacillota bacterium]